jgi:Glycosyl transferase family 2/Methyltransferase domain
VPVWSGEGLVLERELIPAPPELQSEYLDRGDELWVNGHGDEALAAYEEGIEHGGETHPLLHKRIVGLLEAMRGIDAAFRYYGLERLDDRQISIDSREVFCGMTVCDEADLLPYFLEYHARVGVDRFLVVDNLSRDATRDILLANPKVHLWQTAKTYYPANTGNVWLEVLFRAFARGHWCLLVDADELFYYPDVEKRSLRELCDDLERTDKLALPAVLLDMYADRPIRDVAIRPGQDPVEVCPFFDREFFHWRGTAGPWENFEGFAGGVRRRAFGGDNFPFLGKVPLFRYTDDRVIAGGVHCTNGRPEEIASGRGALLHFKFTARFVERLEDQIASERRSRDSSESYETYERALTSNPDLCLYDPNFSVRLHDSRQLVELGIMSDGAVATEPQGNGPPFPTVDEYVAHMHELVLGWFYDLDVLVFRAIDAVQRAAGVEGDFLEIGAYLGKSAILLGYLLRPQERLVVCDLFTNEDLDPDLDADGKYYVELSRTAFEENYARFHRRPATVIERSSTELMNEGLGHSFRIVHVDGSHRYDIVRQDIVTALEMVVDGGIVVVDDYRTVPHALGVAAAVWEAVIDGRLIPLLTTEQKFYGYSPGDTENTATMLRCWALEDASYSSLRQQVAGHEMVAFGPPLEPPKLAAAEPARDKERPLSEAEDEVARLRERLALIEGSRTWRLRNRVMRFVRRGRARESDARE